MPLPATMRCIVTPKPGGPEALVIGERPVPVPGPGEVLVKVAAAGVNHADCNQREGKYPPPPGASDLIGLEIAGTVAALGPGSAPLREGEKVCALVTGGAYAEYALAPAPLCMPVPKGYDMVTAAGLPETFFTVWDSVFMRGRLRAGESILIHGGGSGIGTTAIALAKQFGAARIFATARGPEKAAACKSLGCDRVIDYPNEDFVKVIADETGGKGVDVVFDMIGGDYYARNLRCLAMDGRHLSIATLRGTKTELDLRLVMGRRLTLSGSTLRPRSVAQKKTIADELRARVWPLLEAGKLRPLIHKAVPLAEAAEAHRIMEASSHIGKLVLAIRGPSN